MENCFTLNDVYNVGINFILVALACFSITIYIGRHKQGQRFFIYYCLIVLGFLVKINCSTNLSRFLFATEKTYQMLSPGIRAISIVLLMFLSLKFFQTIWKCPKIKNHVFYTFYSGLSIFLLLVSVYLFVPYDVYYNKIYPYTITAASLTLLYVFAWFCHIVISSKGVKSNASVTLFLVGFLLFIIEICLDSITQFTHHGDWLNGTHNLSTAGVIIWFFAILGRLNMDHLNLFKLKEELEQKVMVRTQELEMVNEQRKNTFINIAHEIRTPLTLIDNYLSEFIYKYSDVKEMKIVKSNIDKLTNDINNIFLSERLSKGTHDFNHKLVSDFSKILKERIKLFSPYAKIKSITILQEIANDIYVCIDPIALAIVINNLLDNALKFTPDNDIVKVSLNVSSRNIVTFSVKDNGNGIPQHLQEDIFKPFVQLSTGQYSNKGLGMGLSIVQSIIDETNGEIKINSTDNSGTEFKIELKKALMDTEVPQDKIRLPVPTELTESKTEIKDIISNKGDIVMIVEDNRDMLMYLSSKLSEKYDIYTALNGKEALQKLSDKSKMPSIIISDIMMDTMTGYQFLDELKENHKYSFIPFIFVTAKNTPEEKLEGLGIGANDYITKPFNIDELLNKVESLLRTIQNQKQILIQRVRKSMENGGAEKIFCEPSLGIFKERSKEYGISKRESEIIKLVIEDYSNQDIANSLEITKKTVEKHIENIFEKTGVKKRTELLDKLFY